MDDLLQKPCHHCLWPVNEAQKPFGPSETRTSVAPLCSFMPGPSEEMLQHPSALVGVPVVYREVKKDVVVRFTRLHERLHACYVFVKLREIDPEAVCGGELGSRIKEEARPGLVPGREAGSMIEDMIHSANEKQIDSLPYI